MDQLLSAEFYAMEGWGAYIWACYAAFVAQLAALAFRIVQRNASVRRDLELVEAYHRRIARAADRAQDGAPIKDAAKEAQQ